jgi:exonuclease VII small subunit
MKSSNKTLTDQAKLLDSWIDVFHAKKDSSPISSCSIEEETKPSFTIDDEIDGKRKISFIQSQHQEGARTDTHQTSQRAGNDSPMVKAKIALQEKERITKMTPPTRRNSTRLNDEERDIESVFERLYKDMRKLQMTDEKRDECSPPSKTIPISQAAAMYERAAIQRKEKAMQRMKEENDAKSANTTPKKIIPLSKAVALYERGMQAMATSEEKRKKIREAITAAEESSVTPTKKISLSEADALYKRGMLFKAKSTMKMSEEHSCDEKKSTPKKIIPLSKATALYDRAMHSKAEALNKREEELQKETGQSRHNKIPLSQATRIYERGVRMKMMQKILTDIELMKASKPSKTIPLSQATSIYDRGMHSKAEALRRRQEEEMQMLSSSKTISLNQATAIYERGIRYKKNHFQKIDAMRYDQEFHHA